MPLENGDRIFWILLFGALELVLNHYVFSFQRYTLSFARYLGVSDINSIQMRMTPVWMGTLGWLSWIPYIFVIVLLWRSYGILWAIGYVPAKFMGGVLLPLFSTRDHFRHIASKELLRNIENSSSKDELSVYMLSRIMRDSLGEQYEDKA